jgi:thiol-disulfide isomerase/thioredoxin
MQLKLFLPLALLALPSWGQAPRGESMNVRELLDHPRPRAPDLDRAGTWLGTDRPLLFRDALKGRVVLLDFWTSGCINCLHAQPVLKALEHRLASAPFQVVGIHSGKFAAEKEVSAVAEAMARHGIEHPVATDSDFVLWDQYAIHGWPTLILVDARGYVVTAVRGEPDLATLSGLVQATLDDAARRGVPAAGPPVFRRPAPAASGPLSFPGKVLALSDGRIAVSDTGHHRILLLDGSGGFQRAIGSGLEGFSDGPAETASFRRPQGLVEHAGALYLADTDNHAIRRIELSSGAVSTVAGTGQKGGGALRPAADARTVALRSPWDLCAMGDTLWIAMAGAHQLWRLVLPSGALQPGAGSGREGLDDGTLAEATFAQPSGLATDGHVLYVADSEASAIRKVDPAADRVWTLVGKGLFEFGDRDGPFARAQLQHPLGLALVGDTLYVADTFNGKVRRLMLGGGQVSSVTPSRSFAQPGGLSWTAGKLLLADTDHHRLVTVSPETGSVSPLLLSGVSPPALQGLSERPVLASRALPLQHLADAAVASGRASLVVEVRLPAGYSFTGGAPQRAEVSVDGGEVRPASPPRIEAKGDSLTITTPLEGSPGTATIVHTVALFYCREGNASVCLVDRRRLAARLTLSPGGPASAIVRYRPSPPA